MLNDISWLFPPFRLVPAASKARDVGLVFTRVSVQGNGQFGGDKCVNVDSEYDPVYFWNGELLMFVE